MSYIRALEEGRFSNIKEGLYVYPTGTSIESCMNWEVPNEEWIEVMFRMLERCGVKFTLKDVNNVREEVGLKPIKIIKSELEASKKYFNQKRSQTKKGAKGE